MADILFFEKPGCRNNTKQKTMLSASGHQVDARNLLAENWTADSLRPFFGDRPVAEWFNRAAPRVKSGEVDPASLDAEGAITLMLADPLLIRRPLMQVNDQRMAGFEPEKVDAWIGLSALPEEDVESCPRDHSKGGDGHKCGGHGDGSGACGHH